MDSLKVIFPVLIILVVFLTLRIPALKKILISGAAIKARIVIGCLGAGVFLAFAIISGDVKELIITCFIVALLIFGSVSLQNKYLYVKK